MITMTPRQEDADRYLLRLYQSRVAQHPLAIRAAAAMARWHKDPRSEGRAPAPPKNVVRLRVAR